MPENEGMGTTTQPETAAGAAPTANAGRRTPTCRGERATVPCAGPTQGGTAEADHFLNLKETSRRLSLCPRTVRDLVHDPVYRMPAYLVRGRLLFQWKDIVNWVERHKVKTTDVETAADEVVARMRKGKQ